MSSQIYYGPDTLKVNEKKNGLDQKYRRYLIQIFIKCPFEYCSKHDIELSVNQKTREKYPIEGEREGGLRKIYKTPAPFS